MSRVNVAADRAHRTIADNRERRANFHPRSESCIGIAAAIHALIDEPDTANAAVVNQRLACRHSRPDLHCAARHQLRADPLVELPDRKHKAVFLMQEARRVGKLEGLAIDLRQLARAAKQAVGEAQRS